MEEKYVIAPDSIARTEHKTKVSYAMLTALLDDAGWKWEHITPNTIRIFNRFYGDDFVFEESK